MLLKDIFWSSFPIYPFEVDYSERPSKKSKNMKTLAIIVKPESLDYMILSLKETGLDATIYYIRMMMF